MAYLVYPHITSIDASDYDYLVFANYYQAQSYVAGEGIDDSEIVPLYAKEK